MNTVSPDLVILGAQGAVPEGTAPRAGHPWRCAQLAPLPVDGAPWRARAQALQTAADVWRNAPYVLVLDDDVHITAQAVSELFRVMRQHDLRLAQPSLSWRGHFVDPVTLHNPSFVLRHTSRLDSCALAFRSDLLREMLPLLGTLPERALLARLLPASQVDPLRGSAVVDTAQALRGAMPGVDESGIPNWPPALRREGPHREDAYSWGGVSRIGCRVELFDDTRDTFLGLLTAGCAAAVQEPAALGELFLQHLQRSLAPAPRPLEAVVAAPREVRAPLAGRLRHSPIPAIA